MTQTSFIHTLSGRLMIFGVPAIPNAAEMDVEE